MPETSVQQQLVMHLSELLERDADKIPVGDNLVDWGLDSVRMMALVDRLRVNAPGVEFADVAETPTVEAIVAAVEGLQ
ncbi:MULTISPECIES: phosphopantetheine-binding protein [Gulosibacter]|uniref:phosphopantetheine-binding protein n=1 Tax=Gulosibacter TaxID=256818 RepID=UPI001918F619|nr:phosphopantetheine-binding protein [Gulosibacter hominis]